ncbi:MAG: 50S ribosomal protein L9 [Bacteroidales bacterium]|nr:50S ribosomal protein L9 [Bacteroidales bacterium]MCF8388222.1 50S ribosomal protein L9 [Bacteroidales bacterium]MCF8396667.1 50S ribosomal protein L9 [Bacteroidales bacterium]
MEIILKEDISNLGYKNDLVTVKPGYARNFLIPKGKAIIATTTAKKAREEMLRQRAFKEEKIKKEAETVAKALDGKEIRIGAKAGTSGKIFGSVNALQIADAINEQLKIEVDRKNIEVDGESIKELGNYTAKVKLHKEVEAEVKFEVFAE